MPLRVFLVGYTDDVAAMTNARNNKLAQIILGIVMNRVNVWMEEKPLMSGSVYTSLQLKN